MERSAALSGVSFPAKRTISQTVKKAAKLLLGKRRLQKGFGSLQNWPFCHGKHRFEGISPIMANFLPHSCSCAPELCATFLLTAFRESRIISAGNLRSNAIWRKEAQPRCAGRGQLCRRGMRLVHPLPEQESHRARRQTGEFPFQRHLSKGSAAVRPT